MKRTGSGSTTKPPPPLRTIAQLKGKKQRGSGGSSARAPVRPCRDRAGSLSPGRVPLAGQLAACRGVLALPGSPAPIALPAARPWLQQRALAWPRPAWLGAGSPRDPRTGPGLPPSPGSRCAGDASGPPTAAVPSAVPALVPVGPGAAPRARGAPALPAACQDRPQSPARPKWLLPRSLSCSFSKSIRTQPGPASRQHGTSPSRGTPLTPLLSLPSGRDGASHDPRHQPGDGHVLGDLALELHGDHGMGPGDRGGAAPVTLI